MNNKSTSSNKVNQGNSSIWDTCGIDSIQINVRGRPLVFDARQTGFIAEGNYIFKIDDEFLVGRVQEIDTHFLAIVEDREIFAPKEMFNIGWRLFPGVSYAK